MAAIFTDFSKTIAARTFPWSDLQRVQHFFGQGPCNPSKTTRVVEKRWQCSRDFANRIGSCYQPKSLHDFLPGFFLVQRPLVCWCPVWFLVIKDWTLKSTSHFNAVLKNLLFHVLPPPSVSTDWCWPGTQNGGQINEKSRDFSANARETSWPIRIQGSRTIISILLHSENASTVEEAKSKTRIEFDWSEKFGRGFESRKTFFRRRIDLKMG